MSSLTVGIVLEGLSTAGKTSVLKEIKQVQALENDAERSVVILGEHYSQQLQKIHGKDVSLSVETHAELLNERIMCIEELNSWANSLGPHRRSSRGLFFLFERFHLNHRFAYGDTDYISNIEGRLCKLGGKCILLIVSPDRVKERLQHRSNGTLSISALSKMTSNWLIQQEKLIKCAERSLVPVTLLKTDDMAWNECAKKIMRVVR